MTGSLQCKMGLQQLQQLLRVGSRATQQFRSALPGPSPILHLPIRQIWHAEQRPLYGGTGVVSFQRPVVNYEDSLPCTLWIPLDPALKDRQTGL